MIPAPADYASVARHFVTANRCGVLSTHSVTNPGFPFGSITPYLVEHDGSIIIYISLISEHYRNLQSSPHSSLTIADPFGYLDPQAHARATALLIFTPVAEHERAAVQHRYEKLFPNSATHAVAHNFIFTRGEVQRLRWIGGFGEIGWVNGESFRESLVDPIAHHAFDIIAHMNEDHREALADLVAKQLGERPPPTRVMMTDLTAQNLTIQVHRTKFERVVCPLPSPVSTPDEARAAFISLFKSARGNS